MRYSGSYAMNIFRKTLRTVTTETRRLIDPVVAVWKDRVLASTTVKTDFEYGNILLEIREREISEGKDKYLMFTYKGAEGHIWMPIEKRQALELAEFIKKNYDRV
jgi:hypothetical protein